MDIKLTIGLLKQFLKKFPSHDEITQSFRYEDDNRLKSVSLNELDDKEIDFIFTLCEKHPAIEGTKGAMQRIQAFRNIQKDPAGRKIARLEDLAQALRLFLAKATNHWVFGEENGVLLPSLVTSIEYHPYEEDVPASVTMQTISIRRGSRNTDSYSWNTEDLRGGLTVPELLSDERVYMPTKELLAAYEATMKKYKSLQPLTGQQFTAIGDGDLHEDDWRSGRTSMVQEGIPDKLVMDDMHKEGGEYGDYNGLEYDHCFERESTVKDKTDQSRVAVPVHAYIKLFDLDRHAHVNVHVDQLTQYTWNPSLGDKLILPANHKEVIAILMATASEDISDIIAGKSGGTIVICTGEPGTGKTLTAEVTSEVVKRPLYKVQCSQLGTDEEEIEKELAEVLTRASRLGMLLLIDEADVYVRERGADIQQNAIVGVFLRVLEYYRGILFLTSNRATIIDDAIMSRATVHLKYEKPDATALKNIWLVLSQTFGHPVSDKQADNLVTMMPDLSGRDVKAMLKLAIRYSRHHKEKKLTLELFRLLAPHKDITLANITGLRDA